VHKVHRDLKVHEDREDTKVSRGNRDLKVIKETKETLVLLGHKDQQVPLLEAINNLSTIMQGRQLEQ
jgi:hypothetical protein